MQKREYFDSVAEYWDSDYENNIAARIATAFISGISYGSYVLDAGCGAGDMFAQLLETGASEIIGVDISPRMISYAEAKAGYDPRVSLCCCDLMEFNETGFDTAIMFDAYQFFTDHSALIQKMHSLIRPSGRFTVAFGAGRERVNINSQMIPDGLSVQLNPVRKECLLWEPYFSVDILCDTPDLYLISGMARNLKKV